MAGALVWTLLVFLMFSLAGLREERIVEEMAQVHARALIEQVMDFRSWCSDRGGVYVPSGDLTPANPYLHSPRRDVLTTDGQQLTLVNPAYMTRQVSDVTMDRRGVKIHLTSLDPLRPGNEPLAWEVGALRSFRGGGPIFCESVEDPREGHIFRYMEPLAMDNTCAECHFGPRAREGPVHGGISVSFPVGGLFEARAYLATLNRGMYLSVWAIGLGLIAALAWSIGHGPEGRSPTA